MDLDLTIPEIEARLREAGVSIDDFCKKICISRATWQRWKAHKTEPKLTDWKRVLANVPSPRNCANGQAA